MTTATLAPTKEPTADDRMSNGTTDDLYAEKAKTWGRLEELMARNDSLEEAETQEFERLHAGMVELDARIVKENDSMKRAEMFNTMKTSRDKQRFEDRSGRGEMAAIHEGRVPGLGWDEMRSESLAAWAKPSAANATQVLCAQRLSLPMHSNEIEMTIFSQQAGNEMMQLPHCEGRTDFLGTVKARWGSDWDEWEKRQQATTPGTAGGFLVPQGMMQALDIALLQFGAPRRYSDVVRAGDGRSMPWPTTNDTSNKGSIVAENAAIGTTDVVFGTATTAPFKYTSDYVPVSVELMQDSATNMNTLLGRLLGERLGRIESDHFTTGAGTTEPRGILLDAADSGVEWAALGAFDYDGIIDLQHSVDPAYREVGQGYLFNDAGLASMKKIKDTTGQPIWSPGLVQGEPNMIDGQPYFINQSMPLPATASAKSMAYGQLNKYKIHDALGIVLRRLDEIHALNGQVTFLAFMRTDGVLLDAGTEPVKYALNPAV